MQKSRNPVNLSCKNRGKFTEKSEITVINQQFSAIQKGLYPSRLSSIWNKKVKAFPLRNLSYSLKSSTKKIIPVFYLLFLTTVIHECMSVFPPATMGAIQ
jgi:hypothetical protein